MKLLMIWELMWPTSAMLFISYYLNVVVVYLTV